MDFLKSFIFICILNILLYSQYYGQNNPSKMIFVTGIVMDSDSLKPLSGTNILLNKSTESISDSSGYFSIWAKQNDTIIFTYIGFKPLELKIPDILFSDEFIAGVVLTKDTLKISEVIIRSRKNSYQLKSDFLNHNVLNIDEINARKNLKLTTLQSSKFSETYDAETNQKIFLEKYTKNTEYKGLISPDKMINFNALISAILSSLNEEKEENKKMNKLKLSIQEEDALKDEFWKRKYKSAKDTLSSNIIEH